MRSGRFLFVVWNGGGNVPPALALGQRLARRGHRVHFLGPRALRSRVDAAGCTFSAYRTVPDWDGSRGRAFEDQPDAFIDLLCGGCVADDVLGGLASTQADVAVVDCMLAAALCAAECARVPTAAFVHLLFQPWVELWGERLLAVNDLRARLGLPALEQETPRALLESVSRTLIMTARSLDFPMRLPAHARYVGPVFPWPSPSRRTSPRPADAPGVLICFSTTYQHQQGPLQRTLDALSSLPVRAVLTLGDGLSEREIEVPSNVSVSRWVPHADVLPLARVTVTHAGHGTVIASLAHGVPLVCVPLGREQFWNAERVTALGAGRTVSAKASVRTLRTAIRDVLESPAYRSAATRMARSIGGYGRGARAVGELERMLETRRPSAG